MPAPVRHTCPDIDKCIRYLKAAQRALDSLDSIIDDVKTWIPEEDFTHAACNFSYIADYMREISGNIDLVGELEDLRGANSDLRDWGHRLESDLERAEEQIQKLESKLTYDYI